MCAMRQCFVVATLVSMTPAEPFIFRNYEHPAASQRLAEQARERQGYGFRLIQYCSESCCRSTEATGLQNFCAFCAIKTHIIDLLGEAAARSKASGRQYAYS